MAVGHVEGAVLIDGEGPGMLPLFDGHLLNPADGVEAPGIGGYFVSFNRTFQKATVQPLP